MTNQRIEICTYVVHICLIRKKIFFGVYLRISLYVYTIFFVHIFYAFLFVNTQLLLKLWHWDSCQTFVPIINVNWYGVCVFFLLSSFYLFDVLASYNIFIPVGRMCMLCMCLSYCCCCYVSFLCFWSVLKALFHIYLLRIKCDACYVLYRITSIACVLRQSEQVWFDAPALTQQEIIKFLCEDVVCYFFFRRRRFSSISVFHFGWWFW